MTGPETQVNKIEKVVARAQASGMLRQSITVDANLAALTKDGEIPKYITYNRQSEVVQVTVPVYKIATLPWNAASAASRRTMWIMFRSTSP